VTPQDVLRKLARGILLQLIPRSALFIAGTSDSSPKGTPALTLVSHGEDLGSPGSCPRSDAQESNMCVPVPGRVLALDSLRSPPVWPGNNPSPRTTAGMPDRGNSRSMFGLRGGRYYGCAKPTLSKRWNVSGSLPKTLLLQGKQRSGECIDYARRPMVAPFAMRKSKEILNDMA
jgi:hypothetical protein